MVKREGKRKEKFLYGQDMGKPPHLVTLPITSLQGLPRGSCVCGWFPLVISW